MERTSFEALFYISKMKVALTEGGGETFFKPKFLTAFSKKLQEILGGGGDKTFDNR